MGEALAQVGIALADETITAEVLRDTCKEVDDVIRQCRIFKHWMHERFMQQERTRH